MKQNQPNYKTIGIENDLHMSMKATAALRRSFSEKFVQQSHSRVPRHETSFRH